VLTQAAWFAASTALLIAISASRALASDKHGASLRHRNSGLVNVAAEKFADLTKCEVSVLEYADASDTNRGEFAVCGATADPKDTSNDPNSAARWSPDRNLRASLIRWLAVDHSASKLIDPSGLQVLGARITGDLDLSGVAVPFPVALVRCSIPEPLDLEGARIAALSLEGSYTSEIDGVEIHIERDLDFGSKVPGFLSSGPVVLDGAKIGGWLEMAGAHFRYSPPRHLNPMVLGDQKAALALDGAEIGNDLLMCCGFESQGAVLMNNASIGGILDCGGGRFINPGGYALFAADTRVRSAVFLSGNPYGYSGNFEADGVVSFVAAEIGGYLVISKATFHGKAAEQHGLVAEALVTHGGLVWQDVALENGAVLDLTGATTLTLIDNARSWPQAGQLMIDGFTYQQFGSGAFYESPRDARSRLRWLALEAGFHPQPYRQLAKVLEESGDETGATQVRIAAEDLRYGQYGTLGRIWGGFLKWTIGYGHRPLLTIMWSLLVVLIGWDVVWFAKKASVMRPTYPENTPHNEELHYQGLHPLLYSLDVFVPFVNLHQEHYWWPDEDAVGSCLLFSWRIPVRGSLVEYYLWAQIIAGWILSAIFVAGVTGLIRSD